jgi:hypothetical protein
MIGDLRMNDWMNEITWADAEIAQGPGWLFIGML